MTNEPNSIGLANIQRPEPARFAESDTDSDGVRWDEGQELSVDQPPMVRLFTEANDIINGERQQTYGPQTESFQRIAAFWSAYTGVKLNEVDVVYMMQLMKISRGKQDALAFNEGRKISRDNPMDTVGYAGCLELMDCIADE